MLLLNRRNTQYQEHHIPYNQTLGRQDSLAIGAKIEEWSNIYQLEWDMLL